MYSIEYVEKQIEQVERLNKRLQQVGKTLMEDESLTVVTSRAMVAEFVKLKNEVDSGRKHVKAVFEELKLQAIRKTLDSPSRKSRNKEQENQVQERDSIIQEPENRGQPAQESLDRSVESLLSRQQKILQRLQQRVPSS